MVTQCDKTCDRLNDSLDDMCANVKLWEAWAVSVRNRNTLLTPPSQVRAALKASHRFVTKTEKN